MKKKNVKKIAVDTLKKIVKFFKKVWKLIKYLVSSLYKKFMTLPRKVRYVLGVWVIVVILLVSFISCANGSKKFYAKYTKFESDISVRAIEYVDANGFYATKDNELFLDLEVLKEGNYIGGSELVDDTCEGYSVVYYDDQKDEFKAKSYVNCKKYTSKDYWKYK